MKLFRPYEPTTSPTPDADTTAEPTPSAKKKVPAPKAATTTSESHEPSLDTTAPESLSESTKPSGATKQVVKKKVRVKKAAPTPTRKEAEEARMQRLHPNLSKKEKRRQDRMARYKARDEQLEQVHAQPVNHMIRNYVDSMWHVTEFSLPVMLLVLVAYIFTAQYPVIAMIFSMVIFAIFFALVADMAVTWFGCRKAIRRYFPNISLKGRFSYAIGRAMMMRRTRMPPPEVKRGTKFVWPPKPVEKPATAS